MCCWTILIVCFVTAVPVQESAPPVTSQPTTRGSGHRKPPEAELLSRLLRDKEATKPILPVMPRNAVGGKGNGGGAAAARSGDQLPEGVMLVKRTGRLVRDGKDSYFEFDALGEGGPLKRMLILKNLLLEQMELKVEQGAKTFKISAETTLYGGKNFLFIKNADAIMAGGNIGP